MQVKNISSKLPEKIDFNSFVKQEVKRKEELDTNDKMNQESTEKWRQEVLLEALESLENNIQMDNTHPLDSPNNAPIDNFDEAVKELQFIYTDKFKNEAVQAQANVDINNVVGLFTKI